MKPMDMNEPQAKCRKLREKGDSLSLMLANKIEALFKDHPDYESDQAWLLRMQSGEHLSPWKSRA